jgi:hypothetical protein
MSFAAPLPVLPSRDARDELPNALKRFRAEGVSAEPLIFGSHRKPEGVVIPFELYEEVLPLVEDILIARAARERIAAGAAVPLSDIATRLGVDLDSLEA